MRKILFISFCIFVATLSLAQNVKFALTDVISAGEFHDGLSVFRDRESGKYGAINTSGRIQIEPRFDWIEDFIDGSAVVKVGTQYGIINKNGKYLLEPKYDHISESYVSERENIPLYNVEKDALHGLFYKDKLVVPVTKFDKTDTFLYPIISYKENGEYRYICLPTGKHLDAGILFKYENILISKKYEPFGFHCYSEEGNVLDTSSYRKSSKGIYLYKDEKTGLYGLKNSSGAIISQPQYDYSSFFFDIWINDCILYQGDDCAIIIDCNGKAHTTDEKYTYPSMKGGIIQVGNSLYDTNGVALVSKADNILYSEGNWYSVTINGSKKYYNTKLRKFFDTDMLLISEGVATCSNNDRIFYIDATTGTRIGEEYESGDEFSEGLAIVKPFNSKYRHVIDKKGNIVLRENENLKFEDMEFSDGVLRVKTPGQIYHCSYIYNPINYKNTFINTKELYTKADNAFNLKDYKTAKNYYYQICEADPSDMIALTNYGVCLNNLGHYDYAIEAYNMVLKIEPDNEFVKKARNTSINNKNIVENNNSQSRTEYDDAQNSYNTNIGNFAGALDGINNNYSYGNYNSQNGTYSSGSNSTNYISLYKQWERRAQSNYNSLTNLGYRVKNNNGSRSGGTGQSMSSSNYTRMKKALREAQNEMRRIRLNASRNGVTIAQSKWETATVGY